MVKSVERTRKKVKKDDNEVVNEIIININQPEEKTAETKEKEEKEQKEKKKI